MNLPIINAVIPACRWPESSKGSRQKSTFGEAR